MKLILNQSYDLYRKDDKAFCDSLQVAKTFGKYHKNILRDIRNLNCSAEFNKLNFECINYKDGRGRTQQKYIMTKDGFTFLVMGYRGKKAAEFKEAYIRRFNEMAEFISVRCELAEEFPDFTEAVKCSIPGAKHYHYINEINMLYSVVLGQTVQNYKKENSITGQSLRDNLSTEQLQTFRKLQRADIGLLYAVPSMQERKKLLERVSSS